MYDIIDKKRKALPLSEDEINFVIDAYTNDKIPDYQVSALLMAICINGMNINETMALTKAMLMSGDLVDLTSIKGIKVDKHSTGGVGDKTTLIVGPIAAACGVSVAKMSGRGLGHTGGTIDKLESIPSFKTNITMEQFIENVNEIGISVVDKMGNIAPADKKLYALRDVTATVSSIPLIAGSIMSKKLASGADRILLDVKYGSGAFMKTPQEARQLAEVMCDIGNKTGKKTAALVTDMDTPLGEAVGNYLEVKECVELLSGRTKGVEDLRELCLALASNMLWLAEKGNEQDCCRMAEEALKSGRALEKLRELVERQGGDWNTLISDEEPYACNYQGRLLAWQDGTIQTMDAEAVGIASVLLGAGRMTKDSKIDYGAGIKLLRKTGCFVKKGEVLGILFTSNEKGLERATEKLKEAFVISEKSFEKGPLVVNSIR